MKNLQKKVHNLCLLVKFLKFIHFSNSFFSIILKIRLEILIVKIVFFLDKPSLKFFSTYVSFYKLFYNAAQNNLTIQHEQIYNNF